MSARRKAKTVTLIFPFADPQAPAKVKVPRDRLELAFGRLERAGVIQPGVDRLEGFMLIPGEPDLRRIVLTRNLDPKRRTRNR